MGFTLAFNNYNIALQQPQPPGYILFIGIGKIVNLLFNDPNFSMIFINIIFSIFTVILIFFLTKKMFSRSIAIIASFLFVFNPFFWFYGEIASVYLSGAFFATLIAYTSYLFLKGNNKFIYISAVVLGISGGFRPDLIMFMLPLWLFCIFYRKTEYKKIITAFLILFASAMVWFVPNLILAGGYENYSLYSNELMLISFSISSVFFGADIYSQLMMDFLLISWSVIGIGIISSFILILYSILNLKTIFNFGVIKNLKVIFFLLWIIPAFLFYLLVYIAKPGYILVYLPAFALIIAYVISDFSIYLHRLFEKIPKNHLALILISLCIISGIIQFTQTSQGVQGGIVDYGKIQSADKDMETINQTLTNFNSNNTILFLDNEDKWRKTIYYYPDYETYSYYSRVSAGKKYYGLRHYKNNQNNVSESETLDVYINSSTTKIIWLINNPNFLNQLKTEIDMKSIELPNGENIYYSDVKNETSFRIFNFAFFH